MNSRPLPLITALVLAGLVGVGAVGLQGRTIRVTQSPASQSVAKAPVNFPDAAIPFELASKHVVLKLKVNNSRPLSFILDTGDQFAIIDLDLAKEMKLNLTGQVRVGGAGTGNATGAFVKDAFFTIDQLSGFSQPVTLALPIASLASRLGQDFDGIIGTEFIKQFVVELDYEARLVKLHDKDKFVYRGPGESVPIHFIHGHPILEAEVTPLGREPRRGKFVFDIGAGLALALYSPFVAEHHLLDSHLKTIKSVGGAGAGGETTGRFGRVSSLKIGSFKIDSPITLFSEDKAGAFASRSLAGNIGARIANKFRLFLDYTRNRIIFEPNSTYAEPYDQAHSGLSVSAEGDDYRTFRIRAVLENSPATEVGLQKDDIITKVNDKPAAMLTLTKLNEMFERPVPYRLTIRRGQQTIQVTLTPKRLV